jgi:GNAT superfamily N-acetyltransferase
MLQRYLIDGLAHKSEEVIVRSALERSGAFSKHCKLYVTTDADYDTTLLLFDGNILYPLGYFNRSLYAAVKEIPIHTLLGREADVNKIESKIGLCSWNAESYRSMTKVYSLLERFKPLSIKTPVHYTIGLATDLSALEAFVHLKSKFECEELGYRSSCSQAKKLDIVSLRSIKPFLLKIGTKVVAAVCSNLHSKEITMVNTLYVEKEYRNRGLATLLLQQYVTYLLKSTKQVCLFYSPENKSVSHVYLRLGFKPMDMWKMTALTGRQDRLKLAVV